MILLIACLPAFAGKPRSVPAGWNVLLFDGGTYNWGVNGPSFQFPMYVTNADNILPAFYLTHDLPYIGNLSSKTITITFSLTPNCQWIPAQLPPAAHNSTKPANVRLYFSSSSLKYSYSDWKGTGKNYWFANAAGSWSYLANTNGTITLTAPVNDPVNWTDNQGRSGASQPAEFAWQISNVYWVGLAIGRGSFYDTGAANYGNAGPATLVLLSFVVQ